MIIHDASGGMIHGGSPKMSWGSGAKNLTARKSPDMLGSKMGTKMVPVRALKAPSTISRAKFRGDAIRDDGKSTKPLFGVATAGFRFHRFLHFCFPLSFTLRVAYQRVASAQPTQSRLCNPRVAVWFAAAAAAAATALGCAMD